MNLCSKLKLGHRSTASSPPHPPPPDTVTVTSCKDSFPNLPIRNHFNICSIPHPNCSTNTNIASHLQKGFTPGSGLKNPDGFSAAPLSNTSRNLESIPLRMFTLPY